MKKFIVLFGIFFATHAWADEPTDIHSTNSLYYNKGENNFKIVSSLRIPVVSNEHHIIPMVGASFSNSLVAAPVDYELGFETCIVAHKIFGQVRFGHWYSPEFKLHSGIESDFILSPSDQVEGGFNIGPFVEAEISKVGIQMAALGSRWDDFEVSMRLAYKL